MILEYKTFPNGKLGSCITEFDLCRYKATFVVIMKLLWVTASFIQNGLNVDPQFT